MNAPAAAAATVAAFAFGAGGEACGASGAVMPLAVVGACLITIASLLTYHHFNGGDP